MGVWGVDPKGGMRGGDTRRIPGGCPGPERWQDPGMSGAGVSMCVCVCAWWHCPGLGRPRMAVAGLGSPPGLFGVAAAYPTRCLACVIADTPTARPRAVSRVSGAAHLLPRTCQLEAGVHVLQTQASKTLLFILLFFFILQKLFRVVSSRCFIFDFLALASSF